jgi:hypothetical protein
MKKRVIAVAAATLGCAALLGTAGPAAAHNLEIRNPKTGEVRNEVWVGGWTVPEPAQAAGPMFGPFSLPPSHGTGLVEACEATEDNGVVVFFAPPFGIDCHHGTGHG